MRVVGPLVGLALGVVLGFGVHALIAGEAEPEARDPAGGVRSRAVEPAGLPAPRPEAPQPVVVPELPPPIAAAAGDEGGSAGAAADALVGILVHGAVIDTTGRPVPPPEWGLTFDDERHEPQAVEIGAASTYAVSGLTPGRWTVRCNLPGYRSATWALELSASQPVLRLDLVLEPSIVLMIKAVTPEGAPLLSAMQDVMAGQPWHDFGLAAIATREPPPAALPEISSRSYDRWGIGAFTDRIDRFWEADDLPAEALGRLELDEQLPAHVSLVFRHIVLQTQVVEPGATEVIFSVAIASLQALLGAVKVRVVSAETREPVPGVTADLSDSQSGGGGDKPDAAGNFVWERQRPGLLELQISAPEHETLHAVVSVQPGGTTDLGTLELSGQTCVRGQVVDAAGAPVALRLVALLEEPIGGQGLGARSSFSSGAEGVFESCAYGRRRYRVAISSDEWAALPVPVDLRHGDVEGLVITVVPGTPVRLLPRWPAGQRYAVRVTSEDGTIASDARTMQADWTWIKRLVPGRYEVALLEDGRIIKQLPLLVGDSDVVLDLVP